MMDSQIIDLADWVKTPPGRYLLAWEAAQFDQAVSDVFGYHALQLGFPALNSLATNRMPHQWLAGTAALTDAPLPASPLPVGPLTARPAACPHSPSPRPKAAFLTDTAALPFSASSLDLVVLPHTLEQSLDPHATLREVERVLVPEGRVVISGLNPVSLWAMRQRRGHFYQRFGRGDLFLPESGEFIGYWRLRDWLRLLSFEVESARFGCYRPSFESEKWLTRFDWMDKVGQRWWPIFGAVYFLVAVKRVRGMRLLEPAWRTRKVVATAPAAVANKQKNIYEFTPPSVNKTN